MHPGFYRTRDAAYVVSHPLPRVCLLARSGRNWKPVMNLNAVKCVSLVIGALSCCAATPAPVRINVTLIDYSFVPDHLTLEHDIRYQLHLENHGNDTHECNAACCSELSGAANHGKELCQKNASRSRS